jgi:hypothetical protein
MEAVGHLFFILLLIGRGTPVSEPALVTVLL